MPPAAKDNKLARFSAQIIGMLTTFPNMAKFRLTGEKLASASAGFPTLNRHHGTKREMTIKSNVETPPAIPIQLILLCVKFTLLIYWDIADGDGISFLNDYPVYVKG